MNDEADDLRRYAETGSEDAFAAIVQRHLPLVYQAARRRLGGDAHSAEDVAQAVFVALARNAKGLVKHPDLTGWLFVTTRYLAANSLRTERRRRAREEAASREQEVMKDESLPEGSLSLPVLDDALMELRQIDRQMILLRFHRGLRMADIGAQLGLTENAAQKRVDRALDRLRERLARHGVTSTATALTAAFVQQTAVAVPAGLAAAVTTAGISGGIGAGGLLAATSLMAVSKLQLSVAAAAIVAATGGLVWEVQQNTQLRTAVAEQAVATSNAVAGLNQQLAALRERAAAAESDAARLQKAIQSARAAAPAGRVVDARTRANDAMKRASALQRDKKYAEALAVLADCYRELNGNQESVERQLLMSDLVSLGRVYPAAMDALREFRDSAMARLRDNIDDRYAVSEIGSLNERLNDSAASVALYDSLPPNHPGRQALGLVAFKAFVEARRYQDAFVGKPFGSMLNEFEFAVRAAAQVTGPNKGEMEAARAEGVATSIEVLTGLGRLDEAKALTDKLLTLTDSEATRATIQRHVDRARQSTGH